MLRTRTGRMCYWPRPSCRPGGLRWADFQPDAQQRVIAGTCGTRRFFTPHGRAFCLSVVLGSWLQRQSLVPVANSLLSTIEVAPPMNHHVPSPPGGPR